MSIAPEIPETLSPYWLRLYGHWVHLEGIRPEVSVTQDRAFSELVTVDGYRHVQRAPRGPRTWTLDYEHSTAAATAALESAAYGQTGLRDQLDNDLSTMLLDTNAAKVNMVDPEVDTLWSNNLSGYTRINVGESADQPIWKPAYGDNTTADQTIYIPVRAGVTYSLALWSARAAAFASAIVVTLNNGTTDPVLVTYNYPGGGTISNPALVHFTFTPAQDGVAQILFEWLLLRDSSGLMVYEGDCAPGYYRMGRRTPCQVSVQDPSRGTNLVWPRECDLCALPREHATFTLQEVGIGMTDPRRVPAL